MEKNSILRLFYILVAFVSFINSEKKMISTDNLLKNDSKTEVLAIIKPPIVNCSTSLQSSELENVIACNLETNESTTIHGLENIPKNRNIIEEINNSTMKPESINFVNISEGLEHQLLDDKSKINEIVNSNETLNETKTQHITDELQNLDRPDYCKGRALLQNQPINPGIVPIKKCCPHGESIFYGENGKEEYCDVSNKIFNPSVIDVTLYQDCIEDNELELLYEIEAGNPCNVSLIYSKANNDVMYVLQNGSLLIMDKYGNESFEIQNNYCLDVDYKTGDIFAIVCVAPINSQLGRGQTILFAIFMILSIPCLMLVSFFHFAIRRLRTMHGLCLGFLSSSLGMGFLLHSILQLSEEAKSHFGYAVQYFMLSYFFWLLMLCLNIVIVVWYYLPRYINLSRIARYGHFVTYAIIAQTIPLIIVLVTRSKGIPGMPSYYFQAWSESIQSSQRYFIPPVTSVIILCFLLLFLAYFGFRKLDEIVETRRFVKYHALNSYQADNTGLPVVDMAMLLETKQDAKCTTYLAIIVLVAWIMEVITFYSPGSNDYLACMEIVNGLQGVFILIFFIGVRHRRHIIERWWHDRGSLGITEVEMQDINLNGNNKC